MKAELGTAVRDATAPSSAGAVERTGRPARADLRVSRKLLALDAVLLAIALGLAEAGAAHAGVPRSSWPVLLAFPLLVLGGLAARGMYRERRQVSILDDMRTLVTTTALSAMVVVAVSVLMTANVAIASQASRLWLFATVYLAAGRAVGHWSELRARRDGTALRSTLIVGAGAVGQLAAKRLLDHPEFGLRPVGFLDKEPLDDDRDLVIPVLGASWDLDRIVERHGVEHVIVTFSTAPTDVFLRLIERCESLGVEVTFVPRLFERMTERLEVHHLGGLPLISARRADPHGWKFAVKYALDRILAATLLLVTLPILVGSAIAVRASLGRPIFFRQTRVGYDGRRFEMLKFRTMRESDVPSRGAFELPPDTAPGGVEGEDRRTRVGAFLRATSIDELPQLLNVLRGDMSLVGPRPERPEFVGLFAESVHRYSDRHRVKAGITGWAQVNGLRGRTSVSDRAEWDNFYIENWSLWLDLKILLLTCAAVVKTARVE